MTIAEQSATVYWPGQQTVN